MSIKATQPEDSAVSELAKRLQAFRRLRSEQWTVSENELIIEVFHALATPSPQPATTKEAEGEALQLRSWIDTAIEAITDGGTGSKATALSALRKAQAAAPQPAEAVQAEPKECRHCGWMCAPNVGKSKAWYPLEQAEPAEAKTAAVDGMTAWRDYAQHLEWCATCAQDSVGSCHEGTALKEAAAIATQEGS